MFHTHTISGIIISAALYVIFFTGSISFLRHEIIAWERNEPVGDNYFSEVDFDSLLHTVEQKHDLKGKDISLYQRIEGQMAFTSISPSHGTPQQKENKRGEFFYTNLSNNKIEKYSDSYTLGEFFYRLHFFAQLNFFGRSGYLLSGLVAFFFLFAVITGVIVHWKKIISSFYVFRPREKWKTIWTDAHVALGIIGLPYQFMFAVTGAYLIIGYSIMLPPVKSILFNGDDKALEAAAFTQDITKYNYTGKALEKPVSFNALVNETKNKWPNLKLNGLRIYNYGDVNMHVKVEGRSHYNENLLGTGHLTFNALDGKIVEIKNPYGRTSYFEGTTDLLRRLHYGDFGGYGMKLIYFVLGLVTCFVILSGVLIWLVARDKKNVPEYKRKFNSWLVTIYMAICLSIYPMTALIFIVVKCFSGDYEGGNRALIYQVFFWGWLALSTLFIIKRNNYFTNKVALLLGSVLGFLVPISNGIVTGNWPWVTWQKGYSQIFVMDVFWIVLSLTAIAVFFKLKPQKVQKVME
tara:strand:- start:11113 stop:12672 length:1560 start_codon:yes stop_codon:yes gene_type:complete